MMAEAKEFVPVPQVGFVATYVPRRCGIATFTRDLRAGIVAARGGSSAPWELPVIALQALDDEYLYPPEVRRRLRADDPAAYRRIADELNRDGTQVVSLQHEYGIFGGLEGIYVLDLVERLRVPVVTTFHTILRHPTALQLEILSGLARRSARVVVMTERARETLAGIYGVPAERVAVIPHGVPDIPLVEPESAKPRFGLTGRPILLSFGLLGPNKRIEHVLDALARVVDSVPDVCYVVVGVTHPELKRHQGEAYRTSLMERAERLGLRRHVWFIDRYLDQAELRGWLEAADLFVTAYGNVDQVASGTLAYALASGKAIVSTPYEHAVELLDGGRGVLVPSDEVDALAEALRRLLTDRAARDDLRRRAYEHGREIIWPAVGARYLELFGSVAVSSRDEQAIVPGPVGVPVMASHNGSRETGSGFLHVVRHPVPPVTRRHLGRLSDGVGIFQHANGATPDPDHGYCTDDVARALIVDLLHAEVAPGPEVTASARRSVGFLERAFDPARGRFRNFLDAAGTWLEPMGSEDSHGRAVQALGETLARSSDPAVRAVAARLFEGVLRQTLNFQHLRPRAYAILGCDAALGRPPAAQARDVLETLSAGLADRFIAAGSGGSGEWLWPEPVVTYDNAVLARALIAAGRRLRRATWVELGLSVLRWLVAAQIAPPGHLAPIGNRGWWPRRGRPARFDQQPIEASSILEAAWEAHGVSADAWWQEVMERAFGWFLGDNDLGMRMADPDDGSCRDGLGPDGVNRNMGAESTLAWLIAVERMRALHPESVARAVEAAADVAVDAGPGVNARSQTGSSPARVSRLGAP